MWVCSPDASLDRSRSSFFFFFNDTATTEIYTLSLHDALPISRAGELPARGRLGDAEVRHDGLTVLVEHDVDRKSTRLNSSHGYISYAVFCLKKKKISHSTRRLIPSLSSA